MTRKPPIHSLRDQNIKVQLWENEGQNGPYLTATIARTYKTEDGGYADTSSFGIGDLPRVAQLAGLAYAQGLELRKDLAPSEEQAPLIEREGPPERGRTGREFERESRPRDRRRYQPQ